MLQSNSLVLYKNRPARLLRSGERIEIEVEGGQTARVRQKDVTLLHPGPLNSLGDLRPQQGEVLEAWELMSGEQTTLAELAELIYGKFTPASAWAAWQHVADGLYFDGEPGAIRARPAADVARKLQEREQSQAQQRAWKSFVERAARREWVEEDRPFLRDIENLALGRFMQSRVMRDLNRTETPENAHALLLELGVWEPSFNPYPLRLDVPLQQPDLPVPPLPEEARRDLTYLEAFAIDDEGSSTPDDAISFEETARGARVWVHVADAAALIPVDSPLDLEARNRGESLHLPEETIHMVPPELILNLGLGLREVSPALSFGIDLDSDGVVEGFEIAISQVRITRLTYAQVQERIEEAPFSRLEGLMNAVRTRRMAAGAFNLDFPEVRIDVEDGRPSIRILPPLRSRALVEEAMILAGIETARFASEKDLCLAFSLQDAPETAERPESLSGMFALRRLLKRSRRSTSPGVHGGLGAPAYTQVTSPLRRYLDLVGHQQLRAYLRGQPMMEESALLERIGAVEAILSPLRQAEYLSEKHWTLVYLIQHPDWSGAGMLVDKRGTLGTVIIPELALEARVILPRDLPLDTTVLLKLVGVDLPQREARFRITG